MSIIKEYRTSSCSSVDVHGYWTGRQISVINDSVDDYVYSFVKFDYDKNDFGGREVDRAYIRLYNTRCEIGDSGGTPTMQVNLSYAPPEYTDIDGVNALIDASWTFEDDNRYQNTYGNQWRYFDVKRAIQNDTSIWRLKPNEFLEKYYYKIEHDTSGSEEPVLEIELKPFTPSKPTYLENSSTNMNETIKLSWNYNSISDQDKQTKFELQYKIDDGPWVSISESTENLFYDVPPFTFQNGQNITWKVRTCSIDEIFSEYSDEESFLITVVPPRKPTNLSPRDIHVKGNIILTWDYNESSQGGDYQTGFKLAYSYDNSHWEYMDRESTESKLISDIGYFNEGTIYWKVQTRNNLGGTSDWSDTVQFIFDGYEPLHPTNLSPAGSTEKDHDITFSWDFNSAGYGDIQEAFELQYSNDGSTYKTVSETTSETILTISKSEFETGTVFWKIRTKNNYGYWSDWTNLTTFTYAGVPRVPEIISPSSFNTAYIKIEWLAREQVSYELQVLDSGVIVADTGEVTSTTQKSYSFTSENDKTLNVRLRIKNQFDLWSGWATQTIRVQFDIPAEPFIYAMANEKRGSIEIKIINPAIGVEVAENQIFRKESEEWKQIGFIGKNKTFTDYTPTSQKDYLYKVRVNGINGGYIDSKTYNIGVKVNNTQIANTANFSEWVELKYNPRRNMQHKKDVHFMQFVGRKKRVTEYGEFEDFDIDYSFSVRDRLVLEKLIDIVNSKETLLLRDYRGRNMYCAIAGLQIQEDWKRNQYNISFTASEVDHDE